MIQSSASPDQQLPYSISSLADPMVALQAGDVVSGDQRTNHNAHIGCYRYNLK